MDLVLGQFADAEIDRLKEAELDEFERVLAVDDADLIKWVTGEKPTPAVFDSPMFERIRNFQMPDLKGNPAP